MKIVIDMYDLGFKMHDLTEDQILMAVGRQPQYRERVYYWGDGNNLCIACPLPTVSRACGTSEIPTYCKSLAPEAINKHLQPYFKKEVI